MDELHAGDRTYRVGRADRDDLSALVDLLRDDDLGAAREWGEMSTYDSAFEKIDADPHQLLVCVRESEHVVATMQLTLIPGLSRSGATRLQIEGVRVAASVRGTGLGAAMVSWAHDYGRRHGASLAQLTSDKSRVAAHAFYERLGYRASHEGFKLDL